MESNYLLNIPPFIIYIYLFNKILIYIWYKQPNNQRINLRRDLVHKLCDDVINILQKSDSLIRLRVPIKIFGSIYGRFNELLRFFNEFGAPCEDDM